MYMHLRRLQGYVQLFSEALTIRQDECCTTVWVSPQSCVRVSQFDRTWVLTKPRTHSDDSGHDFTMRVLSALTLLTSIDTLALHTGDELRQGAIWGGGRPGSLQSRVSLSHHQRRHCHG